MNTAKTKKKPLKRKITAVRDFVWLRPAYEQLSDGGLIIPDSGIEEDHPLHGIVVAVGCGLVEGGNIIPLKVKVGDECWFPRNSGTIVRVEGIDYFVVRENQIFGVVE